MARKPTARAAEQAGLSVDAFALAVIGLIDTDPEMLEAAYGDGFMDRVVAEAKRVDRQARRDSGGERRPGGPSAPCDR